jgi:ankyrin repeat protein
MHARFEYVSSRIKDGMECLFDADKPHFATWLWIYNDDRGGRFMSTMRPEKPEAVPLYYAARLGFCDLAEHLIASHPEHVNARGGKEVTPIHVAAVAGHVDILSLLLELGADAGGRGYYGLTPLHRALGSGRVEAARFLVERGADIKARDSYGRTSLHLAVFARDSQPVRLLLEHGADVNALDDTGRTPSDIAREYDRQETLAFLSEYISKSVP